MIDPSDPDSAYVIPLTADVDRVTPDARCASTDAGCGLDVEGTRIGLPGNEAYLTILRQAFDHDGGEPLGLFFGATTGDVFGSRNGGADWFSVHERLAPVTSVRVSADLG